MENTEHLVLMNTPVDELMHAAESADDEFDQSDMSVNDALAHWGIKGMRWGVRRYQNKDGSLTPAGLKRQRKLQAKLDKLNGTSASGGKKKISEMDDDELREYVNRKNAERNAYMLDRDIEALNPKKVSAGEKFKKELKEKVFGPATMEAGKKFLSGVMDKAVKKALGDGADDALGGLKKEAEKAGYGKVIAEAKSAAEKAKQEAIKTKQAQKKWDEENVKSDTKSSDPYVAPKRDPESYSATSSSLHNRGIDIVNSSYGNSSVSSVANSSSYQLGQRAVAGYLPAPVAGYLPAPKDDD